MNLFTRLRGSCREQGTAMQRGLGKAARSWGFPPLAIAVVSPMSDCIKTGTGNSGQELTQSDASLSYAPHPTPHPLHPTPEVKVKNLPL
ncbi:MAG: hypothetical protein F6K50_34755 [Moorea sp. SIO3I7]|uniref:hypothetical protein n=1 Tax=unclassified Moorena TaxID=2683338 RepID=UPI0013CC9EB7|nr:MULTISPECIES: hypothetical protein [unclassified Moorena]NEO00424.1 hypothetical protein [Moorena sp. SIO3I7]NEO18511.1 hypothetical protein [Moorena sp. SIO4A5]NEQ59039.1 hypothetical protein [Moorena sp. SIO4A1]